MKTSTLNLTDTAATPPHTGHQTHQVLRTGFDTAARAEADQIAIEQPIALEYNGLNHAVMLATPSDLEDLAYGFSYTEGVIRTADDIYDIDPLEQDDGIVLRVHIASACLQQLKLRRRQIAGRTGCGLCGIDSLSEVRRPLSAVVRTTPPLPHDAILTAARNLFDRQPLHQMTGATHAAGWADAHGRILFVREDVGRHNALDKLIGHMLRTSLDPNTGLAMISSRASFEMVQKAAAAGISVVAAVSAPTSYAIRVAEELNVLLAGFVRNDRYTIYSHAQHQAHQGEHTHD